jgi:hypothetical protein
VLVTGCGPGWDQPLASWTGRQVLEGIGAALLALLVAVVGALLAAAYRRELWTAALWVLLSPFLVLTGPVLAWEHLANTSWCARWGRAITRGVELTGYLLMVVFAVLLATLTGCAPASPGVQTAALAAPAAQYEVRLSPDLSDDVAAAALEGVDQLNGRLGAPVFRAVVGAPVAADWVLNVLPGDPASSDIGYSSFRNIQATVWLREDATDWTTFAHEALHCLTLDHSDDVTNLMFPDAAPTALEITDAQVEQAMGWVHLCDWSAETRGCQ